MNFHCPRIPKIPPCLPSQCPNPSPIKPGGYPSLSSHHQRAKPITPHSRSPHTAGARTPSASTGGISIKVSLFARTTLLAEAEGELIDLAQLIPAQPRAIMAAAATRRAASSLVSRCLLGRPAASPAVPSAFRRAGIDCSVLLPPVCW